MENIIFLDTETTGLDHNNNQILQLSYIISDLESNIIAAKNFYIDVDVNIEESASDIHGINKQKIIKLSKGKKFKDIASEVFWDLSNSKIICHNANFDLSFIKEEFLRLNKKLDIRDSFCTMQYYTDILKIHHYYGYKWPKLEEVLDYLNIDRNGLLREAKQTFNTNDNIEFHDARLDVYSTFAIYQTMLIESLKLYNKIVKNIIENNIEELLNLDISHKTLNINELKPILKELDSYKKIGKLKYTSRIEKAIEKLGIIETLLKESNKDNISNIDNSELNDELFKPIDDDDIPF